MMKQYVVISYVGNQEVTRRKVLARDVAEADSTFQAIYQTTDIEEISTHECKRR